MVKFAFNNKTYEYEVRSNHKYSYDVYGSGETLEEAIENAKKDYPYLKF